MQDCITVCALILHSTAAVAITSVADGSSFHVERFHTDCQRSVQERSVGVADADHKRPEYRNVRCHMTESIALVPGNKINTIRHARGNLSQRKQIILSKFFRKFMLVSK